MADATFSELFDDTAQALGVCLVANVPVLLWGAPGNGKTSVIEGLADTLGMHVETIIASIYSPSEFAGLPFIDDEDKTVRLFPPSWAARAHAAANKEGSGGVIVFYDEISTAPESVQAALLRPILSGWVGDLKLPSSVRTVAAANPPEQAAGGWDLSPPAANRFVHLDWRLPAEVIREGFAGSWPKVPIVNPNPSEAKRILAEVKRIIGIFIGSRPELATVVPNTATEAGKAFPTPRSWEMFANVYAVAKAAGCSDSVINMLARGCVGQAAANEVTNYIARLDLPDPEVLLADPSTFEVSRDRSDIMYAVCSSIDSSLTANNGAERWQNAGVILAKVSEAGHADIAVVYGHRWMEHRPEGTMPNPEVLRTLSPILKEMRLLAAV